VPLRKAVRQAREALEVPRDLLLGRYPGFVTGGPLPKGEVPVFVFHSVEPESFGRKLRHLADNGYVTLSGEEYLQVLVGARPAPERALLLTFDDGRGSVYSVGYPLLKRHGMKALVFLVPGRTDPRPGPLPPTWDDVRQGTAEPQAVLAREAPGSPLLSWEEVAVLARSGLFEFHSHTLTHARVHTGPRLAGFLAPGMRHGYAAMDVPLLREDGTDRLPAQLPLGTPLLESAPRTSEALRFFEDPGIRRSCVELVAQAGGEAFFSRSDWRRALRRALRGTRIVGRAETPPERDAAIRSELAEAKTMIEARTGQAVVHLCYPWHVSGPSARRLAREAGYRTAFCGKVPGVPITLPGGDPLAIARIGEDYVELLPGRGRSDVLTLLRNKWARRFGGGA
jgi:peptidoglycan/xylan/chitin deacetylase (PgdA/CDA1 family)